MLFIKTDAAISADEITLFKPDEKLIRHNDVIEIKKLLQLNLTLKKIQKKKLLTLF